MSDPLVRPATDDDLPAVAHLRWEWVAENVTRDGGTVEADHDTFVDGFVTWAHEHADSHRCTVLDRDGTVVGMAWLAVAARVPSPRSLQRLSADVQCVYVTAEERGHGWGSALVQALIDEADTLGVERVVVHSSRRATPVYERAGFRSGPRLLQRPDDPR